ncbi:MAG: phosphatase PAP2 family protein [Caldimonas sp.]
MTAPIPPPARLGLRLVFGGLLMVAAAWLFGAIAEDVVTGDRITLFDAALAQWLHAHANPALTRWMFTVSNLHSTVAVSGYAAAAGLWFWRARQWRRLTTLAVCMAGGLALNVAMKLAFHRARPVFEDPLLTLSSYSFPSGHVMGSTVLYGLIVAWVFVGTPRAVWRGLALGAGLLAVGAVAFSRMYLGVHYLSDVSAAFLEGVAWLALSLGGLAELWRRTAQFPQPAPPALGP